MDTNALKKFAQAARNLLIDQVTSKLDLILDDAAPARREHPQAIKDLENAIRRDGRGQVIEQVAYTWFNRFTALRFMDANGYTQVRVVSPADNATRPEILAEAMAGNIPDGAPASIAGLLDGRTPSNAPQAEAYRLLLVHACNQWHGPMPFLFEEIDDYSELLMPEDLLSQTSILAELRKVMTEDACQDVEIIGWLYQFYISEKKDQVFAGLKKNVKITAENIPAATQLFTPHWIVRYLVENSLGRLWLLNRPQSRLAEQMDYYIAPEEPETDFLRITRPEEIRICDPAAGSGHMLTYAFDLLYAIYEEEGYDATEIPALILTHNLMGVEIDDRAGALAAFALAMKAAAKLGRRRFLRMEAKPDICVLQNVAFTEAEMQDVAAVVGKDLFTDELRETLGQFEQAKNFGSLIVPKLRDPAEALRVVEARDFAGDLLLKDVQARVVAVLRMAEALSPKYHVVVANPPYMGRRGGMNDILKKFINTFFVEGKADTYAAFLKRASILGIERSVHALVTMQSWMFLSSYKGIRELLVRSHAINTVLHLGPRAFPEIGGEVVQVAATTFTKQVNLENKPIFIRAVDGVSEEKSLALKQKHNFFTEVTQREFIGIPDCPLPYWLPEQLIALFGKSKSVEDYSDQRQGLATGDDDSFLRAWQEVSCDQTNWDARAFPDQSFPWFPFIKGGGFRRWYGNNENVIKFDEKAFTALSQQGNCLPSKSYYLRESVVWSDIAGSAFAARSNPRGKVFGTGALSAFPSETPVLSLLGYFNSTIHKEVMYALSSGMHYSVGYVDKSPYLGKALPHERIGDITATSVRLAISDWDAYETSWDFTTLPLLQPDHRAETLEATYTTLRTHWQGMTDEMLRLEEENNRIFIDAYGLQDELTPEVPLNEITLTCNPAYRYGIKNDDAANEARLRADTMAEFLSYAVGCMFGRYSLDAPGLILANQGETLANYLARIPEPRFMPDEDNVIPVLDADWFPDDITDRFRLFLRVTFGEDHFRENLRYIEDCLGKEIRKYFTRDFYADHVQRYKKRPIYWMFSSPKGTFNALIYMHRYQSDTVSVLLNDYLREFISKLEGERARLDKLADDPTATQGQRTRAMKDAAKVATQIGELTAWERDVIFPLAQQRIEIDLDDGVKANYPKFGPALKKIPGLSA